MTKISLTFNDISAALAASLIALASGGAVPVQTADEEEEDTGPVNTAAPGVDSSGLPWDERIHAPSKSTVKDGTWRKKKNVADALVASVESELRGRMAAPIPQPQGGNVSQPQQFAQSIPGAALGQGQPQFTPPMQQPAPMPTQVAPDLSQFQQQQPAPQPMQQPQPAQPGAIDFTGFMSGLQRSMQAQKIDLGTLQSYIPQINQAWGTQLTQITDVQTRPDMIPWIVTMLTNDNRWVAA